MTETHDFTNKRWGHSADLEPLDNGMRMRANGWGPLGVKTGEAKRMKAGDYILLPQSGGGSSRYVFDTIKYFPDPADQWSGTLTFAPRQAGDRPSPQHVLDYWEDARNMTAKARWVLPETAHPDLDTARGEK